ncbi:MAG: hypothetical protein M0Z51_17880 [Propionibacterium sp.]|nr:hypothetical protein [Propionibacterium sp.]
MQGYTPIIILVAGLVAMYLIQTRMSARFDYECATCGHRFSLSPGLATIAPHSMGRKWVRCPECGARTWATRVPKG